MHVLLIGGTNFIGPFVVRQLVAQGHDVTLFHRGQTQAELPDTVEHILGDRRNLIDYQSHFFQRRPDVVIDMIPASEQDAIDVMQTFNGIAQRIIAISSMDVYRAYDRTRGTDPGPPDPVPLTEQSPLRDQLYPYRAESVDQDDILYNYEKILVERVVLSNSQLPGIVLRLPVVYGPGDYQHRLGFYLRYMDDQRPAILMDEAMLRWQRTRGYVENVAGAIAQAVSSQRVSNLVYNVGDEPPLSEQEWIKRIAQHAGWSGRIVSLPHDELPAHRQQKLNFDQDWIADTSRIRADLDYAEIVPLDEAIRRTITWERTHPSSDMPSPEDYAAEDAVLAKL